MGSGGQSTSQSTSQQTTVPSWLTESQKNLLGQMQDMAGPFMNIPGYRTAGFTPDQTNAFDLTRTMAQTAFNTPAGQVDPSKGYVDASNASGAQLKPSEIQQFINPNLQGVLNPTFQNMLQQQRQQQADIGARSAASGAFGGSREAVQRALSTRDFGQQVAQTAAQLMSQGYDNATANAMANAQMRQQTSLTNAQLQQQASMANQNAALQAPQINSNLATAAQTRQMNALQGLLGTGGAQQQLAQTNLNVPWTTAQMLSSLIGPTLNNTDKSMTGTSSGSSSSSGGAMQALGLVGMLCHVAGTKIRMEDGRLKNVEDLRIGDRTFLGGHVIGRGEARSSDIYEYRGTRLNGLHAVFENGKFVRVENSQLGKRLDVEGTIVYPIITERHLMATEDYICADMAEMNNDIGAEGRLAAMNADTERNRFLSAVEADLGLSPAQAA